MLLVCYTNGKKINFKYQKLHFEMLNLNAM
jgi:hypothetical protein